MSIVSGMANIEAYIKLKQTASLPIMFNRYKVLVRFFRVLSSTDAKMTFSVAGSPPTMDAVYESIYGSYGNLAPQIDPVTGNQNQSTFEEYILLPQFTWSPADETFAGDFSDHYIVADQSTQVRPGDRFEAVRNDGVVKSWKITEKDTIGMTVATLIRWKVASVVDSLGEGT
jgi:hypothetical protein